MCLSCQGSDSIFEYLYVAFFALLGWTLWVFSTKVARSRGQACWQLLGILSVLQLLLRQS